MNATPWMFQSCPDTVEFRDKPAAEGSTPNPNIVQKRIMRSFTAFKILTGVTYSVLPTEAGNLAENTPSASYGSGSLQGAGINSALKWICITNNAEMIPPVGTDAIKITQTWVTYGPWEDFDLSEVG